MTDTIVHIKKDGVAFSVEPRADLFWRNVRKRKWENHTFRIFKAFLTLDATYIDIGAWIGPTVLFGAQLSKRCIAIEPDPVAFRELQHNLALNPSFNNRVSLYQGCVWTETGRVTFGSRSSFGDSQSSVLFANQAHHIDVEALTFDDFLTRFGIQTCDFIKMDIEGGEAAVLPTMKTFLTQYKPVLYLSLHPAWFSNRADDTAHILDALRAYPFLYTNEGQRITPGQLDELMQREDTLEVVASRRRWPVFSRWVNRLLCAMKK